MTPAPLVIAGMIVLLAGLEPSIVPKLFLGGLCFLALGLLLESCDFDFQPQW